MCETITSTYDVIPSDICSGFYIVNFLHLQHVLHRASEASVFFVSPASVASGSLSSPRAQRAAHFRCWRERSERLTLVPSGQCIAPLIRLYLRLWYYRITACLPKSAVEMSAARCPIGSISVSTLEYEIKILVLLRICSWCSWSSSFQHHSYRGVVERRDRAVLTLLSWYRFIDNRGVAFSTCYETNPAKIDVSQQRSLVIVFNLYSVSCCDLFSILNWEFI